MRPWKLSDGRQRGAAMSEPTLEQMIEEMAVSAHPVVIMTRRAGGYGAQRNAYTDLDGETCLDGGATLCGHGDTARAAIEALYAAWRERDE